MAPLRRFLVPGGIGALAVGILWAYLGTRSNGPLPVKPSPITDTATPDYFVIGVRVTTMTPEGRPERTLRAARMEHFASPGSTRLDAPHMTLYQDKLPPWEITAAQGHLSGDGKLLRLHGDVKIQRQGDATVRPVRLSTQDLRIKPGIDYAETDESVSIVSLEDRVDARGMQAWLSKPVRIKLLHEVKGHYVPR